MLKIYNINYTNELNLIGGFSYFERQLSFDDKIILIIGPSSPKTILESFKDKKIDVIICVSNNPKDTVEFYNLPENSIIFTSFWTFEMHTDEILQNVKDKNIKFNTSKKLYNLHNFTLAERFDNVSFIKSNIEDEIHNISSEIMQKYILSTGYYALLSVMLQNPKKVYINGFTFYHPKFNIYSSDSYHDKNYEHVFTKCDYECRKKKVQNHFKNESSNAYKAEWLILKPYLEKDNIVLDKNLEWIIKNDKDILDFYK